MSKSAHGKKVTFCIANQVSCFDSEPLAEPVCQTAYYLCLLAKSQRLSLKELYIIRKMGFNIELFREKNEAEAFSLSNIPTISSD